MAKYCPICLRLVGSGHKLPNRTQVEHFELPNQSAVLPTDNDLLGNMTAEKDKILPTDNNAQNLPEGEDAVDKEGTSSVVFNSK